MTDPSRGLDSGGPAADTADAADLAAVKRQFLEAEQRLKELAQGAVELTRASVMLKKARMGISDGADGLRQLSERLSQYIDSMAELTGTLAKTSAAVASLDAAEIQQRLERMEDRLGAIQESLPSDDGSSTSARSAAQLPTDEAAHGKLDRLNHQFAALSGAIEDLRDRVVRPPQSTVASTDSVTTAALETLDRRLSAVHGAVEELQQIAKDQLSAQLAGQESLHASLLQAPAAEPGSSAYEQAVTAKLDVLERGLAAIHQIVVRVESASSHPSSPPESRTESPEPALGRAEVVEKLDALAERLDSVQRAVQAAAVSPSTGDSDQTQALLGALDARLAAIQARMERTGALVRRPASESAGAQLGLYPDLETVLETISNDLRSMEALNVDMVAELRRSLGLEISRQSDVFTRAFETERATALPDVVGLRRTVRWLLLAVGALLAGVAYLIFRS